MTAIEIRKLSLAERIRLFEDVCDSIAEETGAWELTPELQVELDRRLDDLDANPSGNVTWEEVKAGSQAQR